MGIVEDRQHYTAIAYINHLGGTVSKKLVTLTRNLWMWCLERNIHITAQHLPGVQNCIADMESRNMVDRMDWMLDQAIFKEIDRCFSPIEVDLFASRLTNQCPHYYSWRPDPYALATDAFLLDWTLMKGFANPPWGLIGWTLQHVQTHAGQNSATGPSLEDHPFLLEMLIEHPWLI